MTNTAHLITEVRVVPANPAKLNLSPSYSIVSGHHYLQDNAHLTIHKTFSEKTFPHQ